MTLSGSYINMLRCLVFILGLAIQCQTQPAFIDPMGAENVLNNLMGGPGVLPPDPLLGPLPGGPDPGYVPLVEPGMSPGPAIMSGNGRLPGMRLYDFPISEIRRMLDGMDRGMFYDTTGQMVMDPTAQPIFTRDELLRELDRRNAQGGGFGPRMRDRPEQPSRGGSRDMVTIEFTRPEVERMRAGMLEGKRYNYQGNEASSGDTTLTMEQLNQLMAQFEPARQTTAEFTLEQVENMIRGTRDGRSFNYQGNLARPGQPTLTMEQLNQLLSMLQPKAPEELPKFSLAQIENMLAGIRAGRSYNYQGVIANPGERTITINQLIELRTKLRQTDSRQPSPFTLALVLSMLEGMQQGNRYNYQGKLASAGEPTLTIQQLERLRSQLRSTDTESRSSAFTLEQVQAMIAGTKDGRVFNYQGNFASQGEPTLTMGQLETLRKQLQRKAPSLQGTFITAQFTLEKINSMIEGMNRGNFYNYEGNIASAGDLRLTMKQLTELRSKAQKKAQSMSTSNFSLEQLQRMIDGMSRGILYNYRGNIADSGEPTLTLQQLNQMRSRLLARGPIAINSASFTMQQIRTMLNGMNRGLKYNYQGLEASDGQPTLTRIFLERLMTNLQSQGQMMSVPFTLPQVLEMMEGMQSGARYNYDGMMAGPGQETLTLSQLLYLYNRLQNNPGVEMPVRMGARPDYNLADIQDMLRGLEMGNMYNYGGRLAQVGDRTLSMGQLMLLQQEYENQANFGEGGFQPNDLPGQIDRMSSQPKSEVINSNNNMIPAGDANTMAGGTNSDSSLSQPSIDLTNTITDSRSPGGETSLSGPSLDSPGTNLGVGPNYPLDMGTSGSGSVGGEPTGGSQMLPRGSVNDIMAPPTGGVGETSSRTGNELLPSSGASGTLSDTSGNDLLPGGAGGDAFTSTGNEIISSTGPDSSTGGTLFRDTGNDMLMSPGPDTSGLGTGNDMLVGTDGGSGPTSNSVSDSLLTPGSSLLTGGTGNDLLMPSGGSDMLMGPSGNDLLGGGSDNLMAAGGSDGGNNQGFPSDLGAIPNIGPSGEIITQPGSNILSGDVSPGSDMGMGDFGAQPGTTLLDPGMTDGTNLIGSGNSNQGTDQIGSGSTGPLADNIIGNQGMLGSDMGPGGSRTSVSGDGGDMGMNPSETIDPSGSLGPNVGTFNDAGNIQGSNNNPGSSVVDINPLPAGGPDPMSGQPFNPDSFTIPKIQSMLDGMRSKNKAYNYFGNEAAPGEETLSEQYLEGELLRLQPLPSEPISFTLPKIQSMLEGMRSGNRAYNYLGDEALPGQQTLSMQYLEGEFNRLRPMPSSPVKFDLPKIQSMLDGMRTGNKAYNYLGEEAMPGQQTLSLPYLEEEFRMLQPMPSSPVKFDLPKIQSMLDGMRTGNKAYNYLGEEAMPGQQTLSLPYLEEEFRMLQPMPSSPVKFDLPKIQSMLDGMRTGNKAYNYLGEEAMPGQQTLSLPYLEEEFRMLQPMPSSPVKFDLPKIQSMLDGMRTGNKAYNYLGEEAMPGQQTLSMPYLEEEFRMLQPMPSSPVKFDLPKIQSMLDGMRTGNKAYNYLGEEAKPGQQTLSMPYLEEEFRMLQPMPSSPVKFDLPKIQSMLDGMRTGNKAYNYLGEEAMPGQQTLSMPYLEEEFRMLQPLPSSPVKFDLPKIQSMLDGMRTGNKAYNYLGEEAMPGQQTLSMPYLEEELRMLQPMPSSPMKFDLPKIQSMLDGMRTGNKAYNYLGEEAMPGQQTLSMPYLEEEFRMLQPMPAEPLAFDVPKVQSMLDGMRTGNKEYNYLGDEAMPGQQTLSLPYLEGELLRLQPMPNTPNSFDLPKIQSMLDGMRTGNKAYNYLGDEAMPGQQTLSMPYLEEELRRLQPMPASPIDFDLPKIQSMLDGMQTGNKAYNYLGEEAMPGQQTLSMPYLEGELRRLQPLPSTPMVFDLPKIRSMLDGMRTGNRAYNYLGEDAMPGQQTLSLPYLEGELRRLQPMPTSPIMFDLPKIQGMLDGMRTGNKMYNFLGDEAMPGQQTLSLPYLEGELQRLQPMPQSPASFRLEKLQSMLDGMNSGNMAYNYLGEPALPGQQTIQRDYIEREIDRLQPLAMPAKFSLPRLLSLLDGVRKGDAYNYMGSPATPGQKRLTIPYLEREIERMRAMGSQPDPMDKLPYEQPPPRPRFSIEQVRNMINGMRSNGKNYNEEGFEAQTGDRTFTLDYLERMLRRLQEIARPAWMKARVDPAPCSYYNCVIPICYLHSDEDCKSYIVCQRTALGTYVAWKMRCAFGSFWSQSKYTCQKVEEFVDVGQKCFEKDKCQNTRQKPYPDEEEKNCRTYWRCENGVSKPECCPRGQMFDRKLKECVNDPLERCRSPCPLRREGCGYSVAKKEPLYDGNCRTYWDCEKNNPHPVCCPAGHSYNTRDRTCDKDSACVDTCPRQYSEKSCATLAGANTVISYGLDDGNCRTFMKCYGPQFGEPRCCPQQHRYNATSGRCDRVLDYLDECNYATCPGYKEECRFKSIPDNPKMYWDAEAQREQPCAPGTEFIEFLCTCNGTVRESKCKTLVHAKFDREEKWLVKNYGDGWISHYGGFHKNRTETGLTYGTFDGTGGIEVWRFDHDRFEAAYLKIIFQPLSVGAKRQILMSNCRSINGDQPSFEVSLDITRNMTVFEGRTDYNRTILEVPYDPQEWNTYEVLFDGKNVASMIKGHSSVVAEYTDSAQLMGDTVTGVGSMKFGPCTDGPYQGLNNGFVGYISEIAFAKCLTKENKDRLFRVVR